MGPHTIVLLLAIALTIFSDKGAALLVPCKKCQTLEECNLSPPDVCTWGESRNYCGRRVCSKGPGEKCGEKFNILGTCGEGMWCSQQDNRCHGCYIPFMRCYPEEPY